MWQRKKFILIGLLATIVLAGTIGGVALAQTDNRDNSQPNVLLASDNATQSNTLLARVAKILGIDQQKVEDAFTKARTDMQNEALDNYLKNLVTEGKITQAQADQYKKWLQSKPDMSQYKQQLQEWQQARPGIPPEMKDWQQAQPSVPLPGRSGQFGGRGFKGGMGGGHVFGGR